MPSLETVCNSEVTLKWLFFSTVFPAVSPQVFHSP